MESLGLSNPLLEQDISPLLITGDKVAVTERIRSVFLPDPKSIFAAILFTKKPDTTISSSKWCEGL